MKKEEVKRNHEGTPNPSIHFTYSLMFLMMKLYLFINYNYNTSESVVQSAARTLVKCWNIFYSHFFKLTLQLPSTILIITFVTIIVPQ